MPDETQETTAETSVVEPMAEIVSIDTLRQHRQLTHLQEWLQAQLPWQRGDAQRISARIKAA